MVQLLLTAGACAAKMMKSFANRTNLGNTLPVLGHRAGTGCSLGRVVESEKQWAVAFHCWYGPAC